MTEETKLSVSEMIKTTAENQQVFLKQIADHISKLEEHIIKLEKRILEMENQVDNTN